MILRKNNMLLLTSLLLFSFSSTAAPKKPSWDNSNIAPQNFPAPKFEEMEFFNDQEIEKLSANFIAESKRRPAGSTIVGTEDMLSKEYVEFRNQAIKISNGVEFADFLKKYDDMYDKIPAHANDLKFAVARMSTWIPFKGIIWRMTPMVHEVASTQSALLATLKNVAEQVKINMPDTQVEAHLLYMSMPTPELVGREFKIESDFITYLAIEVYPSLEKSVKRLQQLQMNNVTKNGLSPIVFDAKIRFGENTFNDNYDDFERFKVLGEADRFAALARTHRRMYNIAFMAGYNWNGHLALRRDIGKMFGIGVAESALFDSLPGADDVYLRSVSRESRVNAIKKYSKLYTLNSNGQGWMTLAYSHLHFSGVYLGKTWDNIKNNTSSYAAQLDPEVFMARKEQVEVGVMNIKKLVGAYGPGVNGTTRVNGTLSGEELTVDLKGFFENAPKDLKKLLPVSFSKHEDLSPLKAHPTYKTMTEAGRDVMSVSFPGSKPVRFRNYLYGRSTGWNTSTDAYGRLFPGIKKAGDVADAMRILNETRGSRLLAGGLTMFVR